MKKRTKIILGIVLVVLLALALLAVLSRCDPAEPTPAVPTNPTGVAVMIPTSNTEPTAKETDPTAAPTTAPTVAPTVPTAAPTDAPTQALTRKPTEAPTQKPTQAPTQKPTQAPTQKPTKAPTQPSGCAHSFGKWKYEEYTYQQQDPTFGTWHDRISHRKVRICEKCGYKEYGNSPDHPCAKGSPYHTVTTVKKGTCSVPERKRSTCNICGWYVEYDGVTAPCNLIDKNVHLADYGDYTNELDATISTCSECGWTHVNYHKGEGYSDDNRYYTAINTYQGQAYANMYPNDGDTNLLEHPEWQTVERDFKYDKAGYVKQYTLYWWYNGEQYSQVIKCGKGEIEAWFKECGMVATHPNSHYSMEIYGTFVLPYSIGYSG